MSRQEDMYAFIEQYINERGYSPSYADIAKGIKCSVSTVHYNLERLAGKGLVTYERGIARTIRLTEKTQ